MKRTLAISAVFSLLFLAGCGGQTGSSFEPPGFPFGFSTESGDLYSTPAPDASVKRLDGNGTANPEIVIDRVKAEDYKVLDFRGRQLAALPRGAQGHIVGLSPSQKALASKGYLGIVIFEKRSDGYWRQPINIKGSRADLEDDKIFPWFTPVASGGQMWVLLVNTRYSDAVPKDLRLETLPPVDGTKILAIASEKS